MQYGSTVYYGSWRIGLFQPKILPENQPHSSFKTAWEYWLDLAKPKNAFRVTLNPSNKCLWNFYDWLTHSLAHWFLDFFIVQCRYSPRWAFSPTSIFCIECIQVSCSNGPPHFQLVNDYWGTHSDIKLLSLHTWSYSVF